MKFKEYLSIAIPFTISTLTQPLLGAVDTAVLGRLGDSSFMGGVAIGAVILNTMYWLFGFLRLSTTGFAAQSLGTLKHKDRLNAFIRPIIISVVISFAFVVLQIPIKMGAGVIFGENNDVWLLAVKYYDVLIWGAPFVLIGYVNLGWLMGRKLIKETLFLQISMNVLNMLLDIVFVFYFHMGILGVAYATLISQMYGFILGIYLITRQISLGEIFNNHDGLFNKEDFRKIFKTNTNLLIRTICLLAMTNMFLAKGSSFGKDILAANAILFQLQYILASCYEGFANASSVFMGKALGRKSLYDYACVLRISNICTTFLSILNVIVLSLFCSEIIWLFTDIQEVIVIAKEHRFWLILFVFAMGYGLIYEGVYNGVTYTAPIRNSVGIAFGIFVLLCFLIIPYLGNHGLWLSFIIFSLSRTATLLVCLNRMKKDLFVG